MKIPFLFVCLLTMFATKAQYYYNDIVATGEMNQQMRNYAAQKVRTIGAAGFDGRNARAKDFMELSEVTDNGKSLRTLNVSNGLSKVIYNKYDDQFRIIQISDSFSVQNLTTFTYDGSGRVSKVENTVRDSTGDFHQVETHTWIYNADGKPQRMWRVVRDLAQGGIPDTLEVKFIADDDGNIGEERAYRRGIETAYFYYYYDDRNRLSDIVRYNKKLDRLIPDIMFEYDEQDRVIQKITTTSDRVVGYLIWRYIYDGKGLRTKEVLFNNDKQQTGRIEYSYTFGSDFSG